MRTSSTVARSMETPLMPNEESRCDTWKLSRQSVSSRTPLAAISLLT